MQSSTKISVTLSKADDSLGKVLPAPWQDSAVREDTEQEEGMHRLAKRASLVTTSAPRRSEQNSTQWSTMIEHQTKSNFLIPLPALVPGGKGKGNKNKLASVSTLPAQGEDVQPSRKSKSLATESLLFASALLQDSTNMSASYEALSTKNLKNSQHQVQNQQGAGKSLTTKLFIKNDKGMSQSQSQDKFLPALQNFRSTTQHLTGRSYALTRAQMLQAKKKQEDLSLRRLLSLDQLKRDALQQLQSERMRLFQEEQSGTGSPAGEVRRARLQSMRQMHLRYSDTDLFSFKDHIYRTSSRGRPMNDTQLEQQTLNDDAQAKKQRTLFLLNDAQCTPYIFFVTSFPIPADAHVPTDDLEVHAYLDEVRENLIKNCRHPLRSETDYKYLFLPDEQPITHLSQVPQSCNVLIVSKQPQSDFWHYIAREHKVNLRNLHVRQQMLTRLNNLKSESEISHFLRHRSSFVSKESISISCLPQQEEGAGDKLTQELSQQQKSVARQQFSAIVQRIDHVTRQESLHTVINECQQAFRDRPYNADVEKLIAKNAANNTLSTRERKRRKILGLQQSHNKNLLNQSPNAFDNKAHYLQGQYQLKKTGDDQQRMTALHLELLYIQQQQQAQQNGSQTRLFESPRLSSVQLDISPKAHQSPMLQKQQKQQLEDKQNEEEDIEIRKVDPKQLQPLIEHEYWKKVSARHTKQAQASKITKKGLQNSAEHHASSEHINRNLHKYDKLQRDLSRVYPCLEVQNIPRYMSETTFSRHQLHLMFAKFKAMIVLKANLKADSKQRSTKDLVHQGVSTDVLKKGFDVLMSTTNESLERVVGQILSLEQYQERNLDWQRFISVLDRLEAKSIQGRIDLIERLLDQDRSGKVSFEQIVTQSARMLQNIFKDDATARDMGNLLARIIFDSIQLPHDQDLPTERLKQEIENGNQEINLLLRFWFQNLDQEIEEDSDLEELQEKHRIKQLRRRRLMHERPVLRTAVNDWDNDAAEIILN